MEYIFRCPDPDDKEAWRQWTKCHIICAVVVLFVFGVLYLIAR